MPKMNHIKKVLILGSGPIVIGQAAEFDYSGTQACAAIREEGIETILVNSNPATIMTDKETADRVYIEPLTVESVSEILHKEKPDGILAGFGGQTALNLAMALEESGVLKETGCMLLGTCFETIKKAEDREAFKHLMLEIGEPIPLSTIATDFETCKTFMAAVGLPLIIRPAYTLGGTGGGIAETAEAFERLCKSGMASSPIGQVLIEQSIAGWKEIEYEVIRDAKDNAIIVCNMENFDPVGVHTGDSIVVAPSQTLSDTAYQMLRDASLHIVRALGVEGGCNVQFGLNPDTDEYIVIEVNPRVSRSSALASKAAGYPIAKIAAKIAIGYGLHELKNYVTKTSSACFEPALDYVVVKFPKWPFDKFTGAKRTLSTQMKATGEVMAIDRSFESALLKALTSLEGPFTGLRHFELMALSPFELTQKIKACDDERLFALAEGIRRGMSVSDLHGLTQINQWFLQKIERIVQMEKRLKNESLSEGLLLEAKIMGFTNREIVDLTGCTLSHKSIPKPIYKMVDTCSGEFEAKTPYFYSTFEEEDESEVSLKPKVLVLGSGPIRIGQGIEFDYSCVHALKTIRGLGFEAIMINNNPETVSTDFDVADKLYFEPLYIDYVMQVIEKEKPLGVMVQFGGQTAIHLAKALSDNGIRILGTPYEAVDLAEDRQKFSAFLNRIDVKSPKGMTAWDLEEALYAAHALGYPLMVRPSYVIGGRAMAVVHGEEGLKRYFDGAQHLIKKHPLLIDQYLYGIEIEVDAICDGHDVLIPGIMEHVEKTGVHSGDSICVYPPQSLDEALMEELLFTTKKIAIGLGAVGLINIQFVHDGKALYVIEVNPRASRTVPILSKVTDVPMVKIAIEAMFGKTIAAQGYPIGLMKNKTHYAVKVPVFSC